MRTQTFRFSFRQKRNITSCSLLPGRRTEHAV
jgi:hypothetical protein